MAKGQAISLPRWIFSKASPIFILRFILYRNFGGQQIFENLSLHLTEREAGDKSAQVGVLKNELYVHLLMYCTS